MKLFDVYPLYDITPVAALGSRILDDKGREYLDFYGGHAVISIGHRHPDYINALKAQLDQLNFYSNAVINPLQEKLASKLINLSGCSDYQLFLCNSGAEANENALKLASLHTGKKRILAFKNSFHGRTTAAAAATDNPAMHAPINKLQEVSFLNFEDFDAFDHEISKNDVCAVIIEAIQGVGGLDQPSVEFYNFIAQRCREKQIVLIADEVQSGYGRSGTFFAFQQHGIEPDIISIAKGMGNGFPIAGILIHNQFKATYGMLGTTFGGNHLACAAGLAVLEVIQKENLIQNAQKLGEYFVQKAAEIPQIKHLKGKGLMLGLEFDFEVAELRKRLIFNQGVFTGGAKNKHILRILPALNITKTEMDLFFSALKKELQ